MEQTKRFPRIGSRHLRGAAVGALIAAVAAAAVLLAPPVRETFYKGFGKIGQTTPFDYVLPDDGAAILIKHTGGSSSVTVPSQIDGRPVESLPGFLFFDQTYITSITIEDGITHIEALMALGCPNLTSITVPASVTVIEPNAFSSCGAGLTLYGPSGGAADAYARDNNIRFITR